MAFILLLAKAAMVMFLVPSTRPDGLPHDDTVNECTMQMDAHDKIKNAAANFILTSVCAFFTSSIDVVESKRYTEKLTITLKLQILLCV